MNFDIYMPTRVLFGAGRLNDLHQQTLPGKKALVILSKGNAVRKNGALDRLMAQLQKANVETAVFDKIDANPVKSLINEGAEFARQNKCDFVVALGGGSVMDSSKAIAAMATNEGDVWDYIDGGTGGAKKLSADPLPVICITTTAGTGSEVDAWGVITNDETNEKIGFGGDDRLFPRIAVVDPELMVTVPPQFTAYQGFDAFLQAVEVYINKFANPMSDMVALTAIEYAAKSLPRAVQNGNDKEARSEMAFANTLSGYAMVVSSTVAEHAIEHAMSAYHPELPHGAGLIMISKAFFEFFIEKHVCDDRFIRMAQVMGISDAGKPEDFITALVRLQKDCGVDDLKMSDYGITPDEFETLAVNAMETMGGLYAANPAEMTREDTVRVFEKAYR